MFVLIVAEYNGIYHISVVTLAWGTSDKYHIKKKKKKPKDKNQKTSTSEQSTRYTYTISNLLCEIPEFSFLPLHLRVPSFDLH